MSRVSIVNELINYVDAHPEMTRQSISIKAGITEQALCQWARGHYVPSLTAFLWAVEAAGLKLRIEYPNE